MPTKDIFSIHLSLDRRIVAASLDACLDFVVEKIRAKK